jgi:hypothetical protein
MPFVAQTVDKNSRRDKNLRDLSQGNGQALLLVDLVLFILPETRSRILELQEENVIEHHHAGTINES